jgi:hypothetical protein
MAEVLRASAGKLACPQCEAVGLTAATPDDGVDWPEAATCVGCGKLIPPERLEALPGTTRCAACQDAEETGQGPSEAEYCPRCGSPMAPRLAGGGGIARYVMTCTAVPPCRSGR